MLGGSGAYASYHEKILKMWCSLLRFGVYFDHNRCTHTYTCASIDRTLINFSAEMYVVPKHIIENLKSSDSVYHHQNRFRKCVSNSIQMFYRLSADWLKFPKSSELCFRNGLFPGSVYIIRRAHPY